MDISGKIVEIFKEQQVTSTFKKREFVIEHSDNGDFTEQILFQLIQDKCDIIDAFAMGENVSVSFNLKGRKWTSPQGEVKYFNTLQAWKIAKSVQANKEREDYPSIPPDDFGSDSSSDDMLPF